MSKLKSLSKRWQWMLPLSLVLLVGFGITTTGVGIYLENNDSFCASCHTEPETLFVSRAKAASDVDLASVHSHGEGKVRCIECHSGAGFQGRIDAMTLGMRDLTKYISRNYTQPATLTRAIPDENCLKCHENIIQGRTFDNHFHTLLDRWKRIAPTRYSSCVSCHSSHSTDGDAGVLNKQRVIVQCNNCHQIMGD